MAEARSIADLTHSSLRRRTAVHLLKDDQGFTLTIHVPPTYIVLRHIKRWLYRKVGSLRNAVYPLGPAGYFAIWAVLTGFVLNSEAAGWLRTGAIATLVWNTMLWVPWFTLFPLKIQLVMCSAFAATVGFFTIAAVERYLLRILLHYKGWLYAPHGSTPLSVKIWAAVVYVLVGRNPTLYSFKGSMPRLNVPLLFDTVNQYLEAVEAVESPEVFETTKAMAAAFMDGEAARLQRYVLLKSFVSPNYVTDWWEAYVYLRGRSPIMINSNYYVLDYDADWPAATQCARAGHLVNALTKFSRMIDREDLPPMMLRDIVPVCMSQVERMFGTTRVPGLETDTIVHVESPDSKHIVVVCKGAFYTLPVYFNRTNDILWSVEMEAQLQAIQNHAAAAAADNSINPVDGLLPALTGVSRVTWAQAREEYFSEGVNYTALREIESALFILFLSDESPETHSEQAKLLISGRGLGAWFDKSISLTVFANGKAGMNCEHAWGDATVIGHMWEWCCLGSEYEGGHYTDDGHCVRKPGCYDRVLPDPYRLAFDWSPAAEETIRTAYRDASLAHDDIDLYVSQFNAYGKGFVKTVDMSPDSYLQMAFQLAYYRDQGRCDHTYEAAMTRLYRNGRTETVRSVSKHSVAFVKAMEDPSVAREDVIELLRTAATHHSNQNRDAMCGKGCDRHLFALYVVSVGKDIESKFLQRALSAPWRLSTSQQPQNYSDRVSKMTPIKPDRHGPGGGFGPVADDGYGLSYMLVRNSHFWFHVSAKQRAPNTNAERFHGAICQALLDIQALWGPAGPAGGKGGKK